MSSGSQSQFRSKAAAALAELAVQALSDAPANRLLPDLLAAVCDVLDAKLGALFESSGSEEMLLVAGIGWPQKAVGRCRIASKDAPAATRALSGNGPETSQGPGLPPEVMSGLVGAGEIQKSAYAALEGSPHPYGVLAVYRTQDRDFAPEELEFLVRASALAAGKLKAAEQAREWAEAKTVVELSDDAIFTVQLDGTILSWNNGAQRTYGYSNEEATGRNIAMLVPPDRLPELSRILGELRAGRTVDRFETVQVTKFGRRVEAALTMQPRRDEDGQLSHVTTIVRDITQRRRAEANRRLLLAELNHRVKNTLTTVVSIATQTLNRSESPELFVENFDGRVRALSRTHGLLTRTGWVGTDLRAVIEQLIGPHLGGQPESAVLKGERVRLMPQAALALGLAIHELATNAARYGALSTRGGRVLVSWSVKLEDEGEVLQIEWLEAGGPKPKEDASPGFGSELIQRSMAYELGGSADLVIGAHGARCSISIPWSGKIGIHEKVAEKPADAEAQQEALTGNLQGMRVLVVEDTVYAALAVQDLLTRMNCEVVGPVATLERALELASHERLNGALLDINLAGEHVYPASEELRRRGIPFIFLTGYDRDVLPDEYRDHPCLEKPVDVSRLKKEIAEAFANQH